MFKLNGFYVIELENGNFTINWLIFELIIEMLKLTE